MIHRFINHCCHKKKKIVKNWQRLFFAVLASPAKIVNLVRLPEPTEDFFGEDHSTLNSLYKICKNLLTHIKIPKEETIRLSNGTRVPKSVTSDKPDFRLPHSNPFLDEENPLHQMCNDVMTVFKEKQGHHVVFVFLCRCIFVLCWCIILSLLLCFVNVVWSKISL